MSDWNDGSKNIFQIFRLTGEVLRFYVRRSSWRWGGLCVVEVRVKKWPYGVAVGYSLSGHYDYWGSEDHPRKISCAGCYQWYWLPDAAAVPLLFAAAGV